MSYESSEQNSTSKRLREIKERSKELDSLISQNESEIETLIAREPVLRREAKSILAAKDLIVRKHTAAVAEVDKAASDHNRMAAHHKSKTDALRDYIAFRGGKGTPSAQRHVETEKAELEDLKSILKRSYEKVETKKKAAADLTAQINEQSGLYAKKEAELVRHIHKLGNLSTSNKALKKEREELAQEAERLKSKNGPGFFDQPKPSAQLSKQEKLDRAWELVLNDLKLIPHVACFAKLPHACTIATLISVADGLIESYEMLTDKTGKKAVEGYLKVVEDIADTRISPAAYILKDRIKQGKKLLEIAQKKEQQREDLVMKALEELNNQEKEKEKEKNKVVNSYLESYFKNR